MQFGNLDISGTRGSKVGPSPFNLNRAGLGMHGPNNVFNTLNYSINSPGIHHNSSSINKTIDIENSLHE